MLTIDSKSCHQPRSSHAQALSTSEISHAACDRDANFQCKSGMSSLPPIASAGNCHTSLTAKLSFASYSRLLPSTMPGSSKLLSHSSSLLIQSRRPSNQYVAASAQIHNSELREEGLVTLQPQALSAFFGDIRSAMTQIQRSLDKLDPSGFRTTSKSCLYRLYRQQRVNSPQVWLNKAT